MTEFLGDDDLVLNTASRIPVCFCIDTSASMLRVTGGDFVQTGKTEFRDGQYWNVVEGGETLLDELNEGIKAFFAAIKNHEQARSSCEIAAVSFDDKARKLQDFSSVDKRGTLVLTHTGEHTAMAQGVQLALDLLAERKREYQKSGVDYYQPWLVLFTDGEPTGDVSAVQQECKRLEEERKLTVFPFALSSEANLEVLAGFSKRKPVTLKTEKLDEFFEWLGKSVAVVSTSQVGDRVKLDTTGMQDWADI